MKNKNIIKFLLATSFLMSSANAMMNGSHGDMDYELEGSGWNFGIMAQGFYMPETKATVTVNNTATPAVPLSQEFTIEPVFGYGIGLSVGKRYESTSIAIEAGYTTTRVAEEKGTKADFLETTLFSLAINGFVNLESMSNGSSITPYVGVGIGGGYYNLDGDEMSTTVSALTVGTTTPGTLAGIKETDGQLSLLAQLMVGVHAPVSENTGICLGYKFSTTFGKIEFTSGTVTANKVEMPIIQHGASIGVTMMSS